jgi:hypothetical protein
LFGGIPPSGVMDDLIGNSDIAGTALGSSDAPFEGLPILYDDTASAGSVLPTVDLTPYVERSLRAMLPSVKSQVDSINSIRELKDFKSLPRTMAKVNDVLGRYGKFLNRKVFGKLPLGRTLVAASDVYLQFKFNIMPLLRDISSSYEALNSVGKQVAKLVADADKPIKRHFKCGLTENLGNGTTVLERTGHVDNFYYIGGVKYQRITAVTLSEFNATLEFSYKLDYSPDELRRRALLDYFGVRLNPQVIWNAIPWSFVVDWVAGVGQWSDQFGQRNVNPVLFIRRYCSSAHVRRRIRTLMRANYQSIHEAGDVLVSTVEEDAYKRSAGIPSLYQTLKTSGLSLDEIKLGLALLVTQLGKGQ